MSIKSFGGNLPNGNVEDLFFDSLPDAILGDLTMPTEDSIHYTCVQISKQSNENRWYIHLDDTGN
jgi:hypothetical protein